MAGRRTKKPIPPGVPQHDPRDLYVKQGLSLDDVAKLLKGRKGCSIQQLKRRSSREKWGKQRDDWEAKVRQETDARSAVTEADHRAQQLARIRKAESLGGVLLERLEKRVQNPKATVLGFGQGISSGLKEVTQTLSMARDATAELVDDRDDRFSQLMEAASEIAGPELTEVTDLNTDEELLEAMTTKGLDDLAEVVKPKLEQQAEGAAQE